jgi:hypothetical protein
LPSNSPSTRAIATSKSFAGLPRRGEDPGRSAQGINDEPGIVGERRKAGALGGDKRLQPGIALERRFRFVGLGEAEGVRRHHLDAKGLQQIADLPHLAGIVAGDHQPVAGKTARAMRSGVHASPNARR